MTDGIIKKIFDWIAEHWEFCTDVLAGMRVMFKKAWNFGTKFSRWIKNYWQTPKKCFILYFILYIARNEIAKIQNQHSIEVANKDKAYKELKEESCRIELYENTITILLNKTTLTELGQLESSILNDIYNAINPKLKDSFKNSNNVKQKIEELFNVELNKFTTITNYVYYSKYPQNLGEHVLNRICSVFTGESTIQNRIPREPKYYFYNTDSSSYIIEEITKYFMCKRVIANSKNNNTEQPK